jgi:hypothetical protein
LIDVEEFLSPFVQIWWIINQSITLMAVALLVGTLGYRRGRPKQLFFLESADRIVLDWTSSQDTELSAIAMLGGMGQRVRAAIVLYVD